MGDNNFLEACHLSFLTLPQVRVRLRVPWRPAPPGGHTYDRPLLHDPHRGAAPQAGGGARGTRR